MTAGQTSVKKLSGRWSSTVVRINTARIFVPMGDFTSVEATSVISLLVLMELGLGKAAPVESSHAFQTEVMFALMGRDLSTQSMWSSRRAAKFSPQQPSTTVLEASVMMP